MKFVKVGVAFSRTVHPRKYNPVRVEMNVVAEIEKGDDQRKAHDKIYKMLKNKVDAKCERILEEEQKEKEDDDD